MSYLLGSGHALTAVGTMLDNPVMNPVPLGVPLAFVEVPVQAPMEIDNNATNPTNATGNFSFLKAKEKESDSENLVDGGEREPGSRGSSSSCATPPTASNQEILKAVMEALEGRPASGPEPSQTRGKSSSSGQPSTTTGKQLKVLVPVYNQVVREVVRHEPRQVVACRCEEESYPERRVDQDQVSGLAMALTAALRATHRDTKGYKGGKGFSHQRRSRGGRGAFHPYKKTSLNLPFQHEFLSIKPFINYMNLFSSLVPPRGYGEGTMGKFLGYRWLIVPPPLEVGERMSFP